jgi:hypothetical protein
MRAHAAFLARTRAPLARRPPVKKLKLNVEDLSVASFEVAAIEEIRGTVQGHSDNATQYCGITYLKWLTSTWMQKQATQV